MPGQMSAAQGTLCRPTVPTVTTAQHSMALGRLYLRNTVWWFAIGIGGRKIRQSTGLRGGSPGKPPREVELWRARKLAELGKAGEAGLTADSVTVSDLVSMLLTRYKAEGRACCQNAEIRTRHLVEHLGFRKAVELKADAILTYAVKRRDQGAAVATVNLELAFLARAFRVAVDAGRLTYVPRVPRLPGANVRRGHVPDAVLEVILADLKPQYRDVVWFLRLSGWRLQEALGLEWRRVDMADKVIRLETSKTGEPRVLAFGSYPDMDALLTRLHESRALTPWVFGQIPANTLRHAWDVACEKAGLPGAILHDLRRTLVRAMDRAGIARSVAMSITGHRSEQVYRQYGLIDASMQSQELAKLKPDTTVQPFPKTTLDSGDR